MHIFFFFSEKSRKWRFSHSEAITKVVLYVKFVNLPAGNLQAIHTVHYLLVFIYTRYTTIFLMKEINTFIYINWSKVTVKTFIFISNKCCSFGGGGGESITGSTKILNEILRKFSALMIIRNVFILEWFLKGHVRLKTGMLCIHFKIY